MSARPQQKRGPAFGRPLSEVQYDRFGVSITEGATTAADSLKGDEPDPYGIGELGLTFASKRWHVWVRQDGRLVGHVGMLERTVTISGVATAIGGIGGVITDPEHRGLGVASRAMRVAQDFLRGERRLAHALLLCRPALIPFYRALGWAEVRREVTFEQPDGSLRSPLPAMVRSFADDAWPDGAIDLQGAPW